MSRPAHPAGPPTCWKRTSGSCGRSRPCSKAPSESRCLQGRHLPVQGRAIRRLGGCGPDLRHPKARKQSGRPPGCDTAPEPGAKVDEDREPLARGLRMSPSRPSRARRAVEPNGQVQGRLRCTIAQGTSYRRPEREAEFGGRARRTECGDASALRLRRTMRTASSSRRRRRWWSCRRSGRSGRRRRRRTCSAHSTGYAERGFARHWHDLARLDGAGVRRPSLWRTEKRSQPTLQRRRRRSS